MNKKAYQKPAVKKVHLDVRSAVLAVCRVTGDATSQMGNGDCRIEQALPKCFNP
jgi:hypothetical protein